MIKYFLFRYIFTLFCLIGCLTQVYWVCEIYFSYQTTTDVRYENEAIISLPAITLCTKKIFFIREEYLKQNNANYSEEDLKNDEKMNEYLNQLPINEQFKVLYSTQEVFRRNCLVMKTIGFDKGRRELDCNQISPIRSSIDVHNICFTFFSQLNGEPDQRYLVDYDTKFRENWFAMIRIGLPDHLKEISLFIHSRTEIVRDYFDEKKMTIPLNNTVSTHIKYYRTIIKLMTKPYINSCFDYQKLGYYSRSDCIFKCKVDFYKDRNDGWFGFYLTEPLANDPMKDQWNKTKFNKWMRPVEGKHCKNICGHGDDCFKEYFRAIISTNNQLMRHHMRRDSSFVSILPPTLPDLTFTHSPKIHFEEFLCYLTSVISLWFGFSIITLSDLCLIVLRRFILIRNQYKTKIFVTKRVLVNNEILGIKK